MGDLVSGGEMEKKNLRNPMRVLLELHRTELCGMTVTRQMWEHAWLAAAESLGAVIEETEIEDET